MHTGEFSAALSIQMTRLGDVHDTKLLCPFRNQFKTIDDFFIILFYGIFQHFFTAYISIRRGNEK